jgi:hypothetical protein
VTDVLAFNLRSRLVIVVEHSLEGTYKIPVFFHIPLQSLDSDRSFEASMMAQTQKTSPPTTATANPPSPYQDLP